VSAPVLQVRVPEYTLARIDSIRGDDTGWLQRLIDREFNGQPTAQAATSGPVTFPVGEPRPGIVCSGPGCSQCDTAR
jgi:hypothetical protein